MNAYRATGSRRYLADAMRALRYIAAVGWDRSSGGIWWNTTHPYKAGEALASATLLATLIYEQTHSAFALEQARMYLRWANGAGFSARDGLYSASDIDTTPIDYIEGPLIYAQALLCRSGGTPEDCATAERVKRTSLQRFGYLLDFAPQFDAIYVQWMLALYALDGEPRSTGSAPTTRATRLPARATPAACTCAPGTARRFRRATDGPGCCRRTPRPRACSHGSPSTRRPAERGPAAQTPSARRAKPSKARSGSTRLSVSSTRASAPTR